jgi:diketogulonate reductase-like aldo/keto reductase
MGLKYVDVYYMHWPLIDMDPTGKVWNHRPLE